MCSGLALNPDLQKSSCLSLLAHYLNSLLLCHSFCQRIRAQGGDALSGCLVGRVNWINGTLETVRCAQVKDSEMGTQDPKTS